MIFYFLGRHEDSTFRLAKTAAPKAPIICGSTGRGVTSMSMILLSALISPWLLAQPPVTVTWGRMPMRLSNVKQRLETAIWMPAAISAGGFLRASRLMT